MSPVKTKPKMKPKPASSKTPPAARPLPAATPPSGDPAPPAVRVPWAVYAALVTWPAVLDRARMTRFDLVPLGFGEQTAKLRALLEGVADSAASRTGGDTITLPREVWLMARQWLPLVERARFSGLVPLSLRELGLLQAAREQWPPAEGLPSEEAA